MTRIGNGFDVHRFVSGRKLVLGGVTIDHDRGLLGHSDADVLTHAICDALLGAAALGDIGTHFPANDPTWKDISSLVLLKQVAELIWARHMVIGNIDATIVAESPRMAPHILAMRQRLANLLRIDVDQISIKATTTEGLGFTGRNEGIAAYAVALLILRK